MVCDDIINGSVVKCVTFPHLQNNFFTVLTSGSLNAFSNIAQCFFPAICTRSKPTFLLVIKDVLLFLQFCNTEFIHWIKIVNITFLLCCSSVAGYYNNHTHYWHYWSTTKHVISALWYLKTDVYTNRYKICYIYKSHCFNRFYWLIKCYCQYM